MIQMSVFDDHPLFFYTSETGHHASRLNKRYAMLIEPHRSLIQGKSVLDIASHDGRWSFAALKAGAAHVIGIEARPHLVAAAEQTFRTYEINRDTYKFMTGDFFEQIKLLPKDSIDTVLCFGFMYHTLRHGELFIEIRRLGAKTIIFDTSIFPLPDPVPRPTWEVNWPEQYRAVVLIGVEDALIEGSGIRLPWAAGEEALYGIPSAEAVMVMARYFGYQITMLDWSPVVASDPRGIEDYAAGWRGSFVATL